MSKEGRSNIEAQYRSIEQKYRRDIAILSARPKLVTAGLAIWAAIDVFFILAFIFGVLFYIASGSFSDARMSAGIFRNVEVTHANVIRMAPLPLEIADAKTASVVTGKHDLFAPVNNPNDDWYVTFDYLFTYDGGETEVFQGALNPKEKRTLAVINIDATRRPSGVRLTLRNVNWHRVDLHAVPDPVAFVAERSNITVEEATYAKDVNIGAEQIGQSRIVLHNRTPYAYWEPEFLVKLMRGSTVASMTKITVPEFAANEVRTIEVRWFGEVPPSATIAVEPMILYFDSGVYMNPGDEPGQDVRR